MVPERVVVVRRRGDREHDGVRETGADGGGRDRHDRIPQRLAARTHALARRAARTGLPRHDQTRTAAAASMPEPTSSQPRVSPSNGDSTSTRSDDGCRCAEKEREQEIDHVSQRERCGNKPRRGGDQRETEDERRRAQTAIVTDRDRRAGYHRRRSGPCANSSSTAPESRTTATATSSPRSATTTRARWSRRSSSSWPRLTVVSNAVKLQKRDNRSLYTQAAYDAPYDHENSFGATYGEHREALEFDVGEYKELQACARELGPRLLRHGLRRARAPISSPSSTCPPTRSPRATSVTRRC